MYYRVYNQQKIFDMYSILKVIIYSIKYDMCMQKLI